MLPQSHVAYTLAAFEWIQDRVPALRKADLRWIALAALGPDLIDKPLAAVYFYRRYKSAVLFAHTLLAHIAAALLILWKRPTWWPYLLAFNGHVIIDRLWFFPNTFYWPFRGWRFHVWRKQGSEQQDIKKAYWYAFTRRPELWIWELGGLLVGLWWIWRYRLYKPGPLLRFLLTGQLPSSRG